LTSVVRRQALGLAVSTAVIVAVATASNGAGHSGALDRSFGRDGKVVTRFADQRYAVDAAIDQEGRIIAVGWGNSVRCKPNICRAQLTLVRYLPDGTRDPSFGGDGRVSLYVRDSGGPAPVAVQPDDRIVVGIRSRVLRINPDGSLDRSFGREGRAVILTGQGFPESIEGLAIDPAGRILVTGIDTVRSGDDFGLLRLNPDGTVDHSFGHDGRSRTDFGLCDRPFAMALSPEGHILVVGKGACTITGGVKFEMAMYLENGRLDPHFGVRGRVVEPAQEEVGTVGGLDVAILSDGDIVALRDYGLRLYRPDGQRVWAFGKNGTASVPGMKSKGTPLVIAIDHEGRIVVAGTSFMFYTHPAHFQLFRFLPSGVLDRRFGERGEVVTGFGGHAESNAVLIDTLDRIVAVGETNGQGGSFGLARYWS